MRKIAAPTLFRWPTSLILCLGVSGCVGPAPVEDYTLAYTAIEAARSAKAPRFAPGFFSRAEEYYRQALVQYDDRNYAQARDNFIAARQYAEKAENYTVLRKSETGETE